MIRRCKAVVFEKSADLATSDVVNELDLFVKGGGAGSWPPAAAGSCTDDLLLPRTLEARGQVPPLLVGSAGEGDDLFGVKQLGRDCGDGDLYGTRRRLTLDDESVDAK
jgi:hypothetical protein